MKYRLSRSNKAEPINQNTTIPLEPYFSTQVITFTQTASQFITTKITKTHFRSKTYLL
jgi:hypothetical protein